MDQNRSEKAHADSFTVQTVPKETKGRRKGASSVSDAVDGFSSTVNTQQTPPGSGLPSGWQVGEGQVPTRQRQPPTRRGGGCGAALPRVRLGKPAEASRSTGSEKLRRSCGTYEEQWEKASATSMHTQQAERTGGGTASVASGGEYSGFC